MDKTSFKSWIITGGGRGLGRAILTAALKRGDAVLATARDVAQLADLKALYGERLQPFALDVTDEAGAVGAATAAIAAFGQIDVLVNNARYGHFEAFEQKTSADFRAEIETNLFGVVNMTRAVLRRDAHARWLEVSRATVFGGPDGEALSALLPRPERD